MTDTKGLRPIGFLGSVPFIVHEIKADREMNKLIFLASAACMMIAAMNTSDAQPGTKLRPDKTVFLYRDTPAETNDIVIGKETEALGLEMKVVNGLSGDETIRENGNIGNISDNARFDLYFPKKPNGQMVIVCPGGGYSIVSSYNEGVYVADWMTSHGVTVAVAKYRLPNGHWTVPLDDIHEIFRYCRAHAAEWGVDQIGVMGFSAGGHLAASATTLYTDATTRPDFSILIYPVIAMDKVPSHGGSKNNLIGKDETWESTEGKSADKWLEDQALHDELIATYSLYRKVTEDTPPVFLAHCSDDRTVPVINSIVFYNALKEKGHNPEMHIYPYGGHGWGFSTEKFVDTDNLGYAREEFETSLGRWLNSLRK